MSNEANKIRLEDNSDRDMSEQENKENVTSQQGDVENKENTAPPQEGKPPKDLLQSSITLRRTLTFHATGGSGSWYEKPETLGNQYGDKIQGALSPVGEPVGKVLQKGAAPVGSLVDGTVGGVMRMGKGFGAQFGVGFGNEDGGPAKQQEAEHKKLKEDFGGKEQNADNPLGL